MTIKSSGQLTFSEIAAEFGIPSSSVNNWRLSAYRVNETVSGLTNLPLDTGIPQSGTIKFSDFYNKQLNVVVNCTSTSILSRITARSRYDSKNNLRIVGGFRDRPDNPAGIKVWIHTNSTIVSDVTSSAANNRRRFSFSTGTWDASTDLRLDIGPNGFVSGAGGDGGRGGDANGKSATNGSNGLSGTSAIAVVHKPIIITNRGRIQGGGGGGGGGSGTWNENRRTFGDYVSVASGGGGGGGFGLPAGVGGVPGVAAGRNRRGTLQNGLSGSSGSLSNAGSGGNGGNLINTRVPVSAGGGGGGGSNGNFGANAQLNYIFESATGAANPGQGRLRLNNSNYPSATQLYIHINDSASGNARRNIEGILNMIDLNSSTASYYKGFFRLSNATTSIVFSIREVTQTTSQYYTIDCVYVSGSASFGNNETISISLNSSSPNESPSTTGSRPALLGSVTEGGKGGDELILDTADDRSKVIVYRGGNAGQNGFSIMVTSDSTGVTIQDTGTIIGSIEYNSSVA